MISEKVVTLVALIHLGRALASRNTDGAGYISFPLTGRTGPSLVGNLAKRQQEMIATSRLNGTLYTIDITLGSPGQTVPVQFDTDAAELWVNSVCMNSSDPEFCGEQPRFTESSTLNILDIAGRAEYKLGWANFQYVVDYVRIGSARVSSQIFGAAYQSENLMVGVLGATPSRNGWINGRPSLFDNLTDQGAIILGGLDTGKIRGHLQKLPVVPATKSPDKVTRWWVFLDAISVKDGDGATTIAFEGSSGGGQAVVLDSGYTISALPLVEGHVTPSPPDIFRKLLMAFPKAKKRSDGLYRVECLLEGKGGSVSFTFGNVTIDVPYYDFVFHVPSEDDYCVLGAFEDDLPVLGDNFLRAAYVIYDFDQQTVHIAQSDDCGSNVVPIGPEGTTVTEGDCGKI